MPSLDLHGVLYLYKTPSTFFIQPVHQPNEALVIDRQTCSITLNTMFSISHLPANATSCLIYGLIGIKHLIDCPYLIVITKATQIGLITGETIYKMDEAQVIPFSNNDSGPGSQHDWNATYVSMLESVLQMPNYYFSYTHDLTNSIQRNHGRAKTSTVSYSDYDQRFLWNSHVMLDFDRCPGKASKYRLPFILGFISINKTIIGNIHATWTLVSRRSTRRAGTRFNSRGIDHDGNVSNFVETEQIVEDHEGTVSSFVQVRGSIPLMWRQKVNYKYKPPIEVDQTFNHEVPMKKHLEELKNYYGNISIVSLIDQRGHEGQLAHEFSSRMGYIQKYHNIPYHNFDFHKECSKMRWHRLSILIDNIMSEIEAYGYYLEVNHGHRSYQSGVIRSNCIDSLDRTNVVQGMIAQFVLERQLNHFSQTPRIFTVSACPEFLSIFKNVWADNADALSIQYAGTPALKTDFTRTGKRTHMGLVKDGANSVTRYVWNNFFDDYRQDAIDLLLGQFEGYPSPLYRPMSLTSYTSPIPLAVLAMTLILLYIYMPSLHFHNRLLD